MNSPFIRWLLDLDLIPADATGLRLVWEHPWPAWVWLALLITAGFLAAWSYARIQGLRPGRVVLAGVRFALVGVVLLVISGPMLELPRETVEQDWVLMLVDRSASMGIADVESAQGRLTRDQQLRGLLKDNEDLWQELAAGRHVVWLGFDDGAFDLVTDEPSATDGADAGDQPRSPVRLEDPDGRRTRLNVALEQAMQRAAARALSGLVVFTDGKTTDPPTRAAIRRLRSDKVGVFTVPLGSPAPLGDLAIRRAEAPRRAFVRDKVPVVVELDQLGASTGEVGATVKLIDASAPGGEGEVLAEVRLPPDGEPRREVTLVAEPQLAGEATWQVVVETDRPDLIAENNAKTFLIDLIDRPLRVLFVEGYPRWEYRYLKNLMIREKSIESSVMLISADRDFAQEGNQPITRLPRSPEEFAPFDVVVLGDVPGSFFSPEQLEMIREHVAGRGAGLLWIGGEHYTPRTYAGTALADLLPLRGTLALAPIGSPVNMVPTELARRLGFLQLAGEGQSGWPAELADPSLGWSELYWAQRIEPGRLKPTAEVLAETLDEYHGAHLPLVIQMRYGAGQIIYVATDEVWRWRYGRGEQLPERFWVQIIRKLGRESLAGSDEGASFEVNPRRLTTSQVMRVDLELFDARLIDETRTSVGAVVQNADGSPIAELELRRLDDAQEEAGRGKTVRFATTYRPGVTGQLTVRVDDPTLADLRLAVPVDVFTPDDELRQPETDHGLLAALSAETGARSLAPDELSQLATLLPNRSVRTINPLTERIWDTPLVFGLLLLLLAAEWIGRKLIRLA